MATEPLDRLSFILTAGQIFRDALNTRAIEELAANPALLVALATLRLGSAEMTPAEAKRLVGLGLLSVDHQGYFVSPVVEDAIDELLRQLEAEGTTLSELVSQYADEIREEES